MHCHFHAITYYWLFQRHINVSQFTFYSQHHRYILNSRCCVCNSLNCGIAYFCHFQFRPICVGCKMYLKHSRRLCHKLARFCVICSRWLFLIFFFCAHSSSIFSPSHNPNRQLDEADSRWFSIDISGNGISLKFK